LSQVRRWRNSASPSLVISVVSFSLVLTVISLISVRFLHQKLLIALVEESVASRARSIICSNFENKCHELGARLGDIQLFRTHDYNIQFINETWFGEHKLKEKSEVERKKWAQIRPALRELVLNFESEINNVSSNVYIEDRLRDRVVDVDWLFVSAQMVRFCFIPN